MQMILTTTGYRVLNDDVDDGKWHDFITEPINFVSDIKNEGIWFALTGKGFGEWLKDLFINMGKGIVIYSDVLILVGTVLMLFIMFGSKKALKMLYWTLAIYVVIKGLGVMLWE